MAWRVCTLLLALVALASCQIQSYSYSSFAASDMSDFQLNGQAASLNPNAAQKLRLTSNGGNLVGSAFFLDSIPLEGPNGFKASFSTAFSFQMDAAGNCGDEDGVGADGFVFVVNSVTNQVGSLGGGMGYANLPKSIGIEFDTYNNQLPQDNDGNHVGIDINGNIISSVQRHFNTRLNDGAIHYAWVDYNGDTKTLEVRVANDANRPSAAYISSTVDLVSILQTPNVYVGFTAATGSCWENHYITSWTFTNQYAPIVAPPPAPVCGNGVVENGEACDGGSCCTSSCTFMTSLCRASTGPCDPAEYCSGNYYQCPADSFYSASTVCRASNGPCDVAETCTGSSGACPADSVAATSRVCRASNGPCDVAETCDGSNVACPADSFAAAFSTCRASNGPCDVAETCTGSSASCPADSFTSSGVVCRSASGVCDVAETCSGSSASCPADAMASSSTVCRGSNGPCDVAETCTGSSSSCPADSFASASQTCRPSTGICDIAEQCTGFGASCPSDAFSASTTVCRAAAGICDVAETCTGSSGACPANSFASTSTVCRASNGICDVAETCDGVDATCPADSYASSSQVCRPSNGPCDVADRCPGTGPSCSADAFASASQTCRPSAGVCDVAEQCTGTGASCPADSFASSSVTCRGSNGPCDVAEQCTGSGSACPADSFSPASQVCRASAGDCDVAESCTGSNADCPVNEFVASDHVCRAAAGICDAPESCTGWTATCPENELYGSSELCRASISRCDPQEVCAGDSVDCPADISGDFETACSGLTFTIDGNDYSFMDFSVISFNNFIGFETGAVEGRIAAKNNVRLGAGYSVGYSLQTSQNGVDNSLPYSLVAGNDINWTSGAVFPAGTGNPYPGNQENMFAGSGVFTGSADLALRVTGSCPVSGCLNSEFDAARSCYGIYQSSMSDLTDNVEKLIQWSGLYLTCDDANAARYVLSLTPAEMTQYTYTIQSNCNADAKWVINVRGSGDVAFSGASFPGEPAGIVWNVVGSGRTINVQNVQIQGNIVAPYNTLYQPSGQINGKVIVWDVTSSRNILKAGCFDSSSGSV